MKKVLGILAIVSVLSLSMIGCTPQAEGDTAQPETTKPDAGTASTPAPDAK